MNRDVQDLLAECDRQGLRVTYRSNGHAKVQPKGPGKEVVWVGGTPSDRRAMLNAISQLRRIGLIWPPPPKKGSR